jgi:N-acetylglucosaminylphosphatidylinositol deacetylase
MLPFFVVLVLSLVSAFLYLPLSSKNGLILGNYPRVLLLTAHPDDEAMFFAPTLLALTSASPLSKAPIDLEDQSQVVFSTPQPQIEVFSLCLSTGNADGLGNVRPTELHASLDVLGISKDRRWLIDDR